MNEFDKISYAELNHLQIGRLGEYWTKIILTLNGFDIYTSEVDDKGIDFVVRVSKEKYIDIQVKTVREKTSYVFVSKETWNNELRENLFLSLVLLFDCREPKVYLIPSISWREENNLLKSRDYLKEGQKSKPEWGLNISKRNLHLLEKYEAKETLKSWLT